MAAESSHLAANGVVFGGLIGDEPIGRGRFATVWRAKSAGALGTGSAAVKIFRNTGSAVRAFRYEADILGHIGRAGDSGPFVTQIMDAGVYFSQHPHVSLHCWFSMPLEGNSMKGALRGNLARYGCTLPPNVVRAVARSLFQALQFIHSVGVIHCDLKPENILLAYGSTVDSPLDQIHVKLADFGAALLVDGVDNRACGTLYYASPEVHAISDVKIETAVDIWSAGVTIYYLLTDEHLIDYTDTETNYELEIDDDYDDDAAPPATQSDPVPMDSCPRTDFDILDDANDISTDAEDYDDDDHGGDKYWIERNYMQVCEKLFGCPPATTRALFSKIYGGDGRIEAVVYPIPRVEISDLLLKRHKIGMLTSHGEVMEIAAFIVNCMRYRPSDRYTAAAALASGWLSS